MNERFSSLRQRVHDKVSKSGQTIGSEIMKWSRYYLSVSEWLWLSFRGMDNETHTRGIGGEGRRGKKLCQHQFSLIHRNNTWGQVAVLMISSYLYATIRLYSTPLKPQWWVSECSKSERLLWIKIMFPFTKIPSSEEVVFLVSWLPEQKTTRDHLSLCFDYKYY